MTNFKEDGYVKVLTFTGDVIYYNDVEHTYKDSNGKVLKGASSYKKRFEKPFFKDHYASKVAKSNDIGKEVILDIWERNGQISILFGNTVHTAMEQYWKHRDNSCGDKQYHFPKHPIIRNIVETFPQLNEKDVRPEVFVSNLDTGLVGQIDAIHVTNLKEKRCKLWDYKTDADLTKQKLRLHFIQLSVYADILRRNGWTVEEIIVWNFTGDGWIPHSQDPFNLEELEKETIMVN